MIPVTIPNRPFSSDIITNLMLPDGFFEASLGKQRLNAQFKNQGAASVAAVGIYVESVSNPGLVVTPQTFTTNLSGAATRVLSWDIDVSAAPPGAHHVSFIIESAADRTRVIKKIFVTRVTFDPTTITFTAEAPEGVMRVRFRDWIKPRGCCGDKRRPQDVPGTFPGGQQNLLNVFDRFFFDPQFEFCPPGYLPVEGDISVSPTPPYSGQFGDLPYQDPWWKVLLCIIAVILLIAASIVAATSGSGSVTVGPGSTPTGSPVEDCCGVRAGGGSSNYVVAGLVAGAAAAATAAGLSDARDPFRRGQDNTPPTPGAITLSENLHFQLGYPEPVTLGRPFAVQAKWEYTRVTTAGSFTFAVNEVNTNVHVLNSYRVTAPEVVRFYRREPFLIKAEFLGPDDKPFRGEQLFVQCFLFGPGGQFVRLVLQDDGNSPDDKPNDGIYTAIHFFSGGGGTTASTHPPDPRGLWHYFVIAQDVNSAQPAMAPEDAAQIIGGMVLTSQLTIDFTNDDCPFVPDGHVNVV